MKKTLCVLLAVSLLIAQSTSLYSPDSGVTINFSGAAATRVFKTGTAPPGTCTIGDLFYDTDATAGQNLFGCTATNTWTAQAGGGAVASVFGRTGAVVATSGDYTAAQVTNAASTAAGNTFSSGSKQIFTASASTSGARIVCAALPSTPATGDIACDSADSNRLKVWDGSVWQSAAGGTGATMFTGLGDLAAVRTDGDTLTVGTNCSSTTPCVVKRGISTAVFTAAATVELTGATGTVRVGIDKSATPLTLRAIFETITGGTCTGMNCTTTSGSAFEADMDPLFTWTATSGVWDTNGKVDLRGVFGAGLRVVAGAGISATNVAGNVTVAVDSAIIPTKIEITTAAIDLGSIANGACLTSSTFTVTGAATGDVAEVAPPATGTLLSQEGLIFKGLVTAANTGVVRVCNLSGGAYDPPSAAYTFVVLQ